MNFTELVQSVGWRARVDHKLPVDDDDVSIIVKETLSSIADSLAAGNDVRLRGFGTFFTALRKASTTIDPATGGERSFPPITTYRWRPAEGIKRQPR